MTPGPLPPTRAFLNALQANQTTAARPVEEPLWCSESGGHVVDGDELVSYADRQTVGYCKFCHDRISITIVPGGEVAVWAKGRVMAEAQVGSSAEGLTRLQETRAVVERDLARLQETLDLLDMMIIKVMP